MEKWKESKYVIDKQKSSLITRKRIPKWGYGCELGMSVWYKMLHCLCHCLKWIFHIDHGNSRNGCHTYLQKEAIRCCRSYYLECYSNMLLIIFQSCRDNIHNFHIKYTTILCTKLNTCELSMCTHSHILSYSFRSTILRITTTTWRWARYSRWLEHSIQRNMY